MPTINPNLDVHVSTENYGERIARLEAQLQSQRERIDIRHAQSESIGSELKQLTEKVSDNSNNLYRLLVGGTVAAVVFTAITGISWAYLLSKAKEVAQSTVNEVAKKEVL